VNTKNEKKETKSKKGGLRRNQFFTKSMFHFSLFFFFEAFPNFLKKVFKLYFVEAFPLFFEAFPFF